MQQNLRWSKPSCSCVREGDVRQHTRSSPGADGVNAAEAGLLCHYRPSYVGDSRRSRDFWATYSGPALTSFTASSC
jgi:hypothetical protein